MDSRQIVDINKMIEQIGPEHVHEILDIMGIEPGRQWDLESACEWKCGVENRWWRLDARMLYLSDLYAVRWTYAAEAGIDDLEIVETYEEEEINQSELDKWLKMIAQGAGSTSGEVRMV